jgi:hypothetical protein
LADVYLVDGARTAFTKFVGSFAQTGATELGKVSAVEALRRSNVDPMQIDHVIYGSVIHKNASYISRHIGLYSGVPQEVPAFYKQMVIDASPQDILYTNSFSGVYANIPIPSLLQQGIDPNTLLHREDVDLSHLVNVKGVARHLVGGAWRCSRPKTGDYEGDHRTANAGIRRGSGMLCPKQLEWNKKTAF